mmetsp:Transcript_61967/g.98657  ORF Transcript_61967/g.98657 Transcript_61967/m.98657 type:complete len:548 (+) Transcript_61967:33-1676(+)|eukprot:CAMPEP_0197028802 /NCGR_PEP_ID=MMETSP1384-20130603/8403_1 /TAXON_ID=29189 /ORGANISM="Ammonia sp." /LENGTH=547 /DNA_ID=CAMNT_0042457861 /DNA_START=29 /DNA_END=1672 /DNA_ORIENTATION=-
MGNCCGVKSAPSNGELNPLELEAHQGIEDGLMNAFRSDSRIKKLLLLGAGSSGKSTIFRQLKYVYDAGLNENELNEMIPIMRRNCVAGIMKLLQKTQQLFEADASEHKDCYIDLDKATQSVLNSIKTVINLRHETFDDFENNFLHYIDNLDDDHTSIDDHTERSIQEKKATLQALSHSIAVVWQLPEIQATWSKRNSALVTFSFPDNMDYFFVKVDKVFEWNYLPSSDDIMRCRMKTTGVNHAYYEQEKTTFTITDVGGQRNERRKWIHQFERVTAVIYVAALNHYAAVLYEDESINAMIESIDLFFEVCNMKWFRKTEFILFLNKDDLFREFVQRDIPLSMCFNADNHCIYKKEYDDEDAYYPKPSSNARKHSKASTQRSTRTNHMDLVNNKSHEAVPADIDVGDEEEDNLAMIGNHGDTEYGEYDMQEVGSSYTYSPSAVADENDTFEYRSKSAIYPKPELRLSAKNTYEDGRWANVSDEKWFDFVYHDYLHFITEQYLSKNLHSSVKRVFVHVCIATDPNNIKKVFYNTQNIIIRSNLKHGGLV